MGVNPLVRGGGSLHPPPLSLLSSIPQTLNRAARVCHLVPDRCLDRCLDRWVAWYRTRTGVAIDFAARAPHFNSTHALAPSTLCVALYRTRSRVAFDSALSVGGLRNTQTAASSMLQSVPAM
eukprot:2973668-Rhodomonas_salina.2